MRGQARLQDGLFSYVSIEQRIPKDHPIRAMRKRTDLILDRMSPDFDRIYSDNGRPSIPPEYLLKSLWLQVLYSVRSERLLLEQLDYNMMFRWFVGLGADDRIWEETVFSKNRQRLLDGDIADKFFTEVVTEAEREGLVSCDHFTVDGTVVQAWASLKSFQRKQDRRAKKKDRENGGDPKSRNGDVNFHGEKRSNETHESSTDSESRLYRKSQNQGAQLSYLGHVAMENRNGLAVDQRLTQAMGTAEREAAIEMAMSLGKGSTLGGDKGYDTKDCVNDLKSLGVTPHVAQNLTRVRGGSAIDRRTTRHPGYKVSQRIRKRVEEIFGWLKTVGPMRQTHFRGQRRVAWMFSFSLAVYNLVRMGNLCDQRL